MARNNILIKLVFGDIVANQNKISATEQFLEADENLGINETEQLKKYKEIYDNLVRKINSDLNTLSNLEGIIVQLRCIEMVPNEIKFSLLRDYIYARTTFYRPNNEIRDIRVIVGKLEDFDEPYETIIEYPEFILMAQNKLKETMSNIMKKNGIDVENLHEENLINY